MGRKVRELEWRECGGRGIQAGYLYMGMGVERRPRRLLSGSHMVP